MIPAIPPRGADEDALLRRRRELLGRLGVDVTEENVPHGSMGLALSGGGIRSATISLGLIQALARHRRLLDFDYLSTVSGGGYLGSFLTSLFVPDEKRGRTGSPSTVGTLGEKEVMTFVERVLSYDAKQEEIDDPFPTLPVSDRPFKGKLRNPIWWLREHGRYLAPNGPTDFGYALSYLARNWLAMIYTVTVAAAALFFLATAVEFVILCAAPTLATHLHVRGGGAFVLSPLIVLPPVFLALGLATGLSYWLTVSLRTGNPWEGTPSKMRPPPGVQFALQTLMVLGATMACVELLLHAGIVDHFSVRVVANFWELSWPWWPIALGIDLALVGLVIGGLAAIFTAVGQSGDAFTNELRRRLTKLGALLNQALAVSVALAVVDTLAMALVGPGRQWIATNPLPGLFGAAAIPLAASLIRKLPQWLGGGRITKFLGEHLWAIALVTGALLFALVALVADTGVQAVAWPATPWGDGKDFGLALDRFVPLGLLIWGLFVLTGMFTGFINLSSLHNLYAGRLSRAYLGASNIARLRQAATEGAPITENHPKDYIDISCYQDLASAAPLHLINVTLNETRSNSRSQLVDRDRKGIPVVFAPDGLYVDAARARTLGQDFFFPWRGMRDAGVESLSVGQLCAISGAAAGSGMGARTTLGGALALTFANVRLGYWWALQDLLPEAKALAGTLWWRIYTGLTRPFRTYFYLWNEMTATYARENRRVYLSDGGHFENSGAYELLRRNVEVLLVCDNGADPAFAFEDLENLVRKARIDLGRAVIVTPSDDVRALFGSDGTDLFFNGKSGDWRQVALARSGPACALLLDVYTTRPSEHGATSALHERCGRIVWLKPRLFDDLPPDVAGYGLRNAPFPQQTTGDQFFDEAQWESYRALGYAIGDVLLNRTKHDADVLRALLTKHRPRQTPPVRPAEHKGPVVATQ